MLLTGSGLHPSFASVNQASLLPESSQPTSLSQHRLAFQYSPFLSIKNPSNSTPSYPISTKPYLQPIHLIPVNRASLLPESSHPTSLSQHRLAFQYSPFLSIKNPSNSTPSYSISTKPYLQPIHLIPRAYPVNVTQV